VTRKIVSEMTYNVLSGTLNFTIAYDTTRPVDSPRGFVFGHLCFFMIFVAIAML